MAKSRDWILRSVLACCVLALSAALLLFTQFFLQSALPLDTLWIAEFTTVPGLQTWDTVVLGLFLLLLAILLYAAARQRAISNNQLRPSAGCPSCHESRLIRVSRESRDRFLSFSLIPLGRFVCPGCRWEGRRVIRKPTYSSSSIAPEVPMELIKANDMSEIASSAKPGSTVRGSMKTQEAARTSDDTGVELSKKSHPPQAGEKPDLSPTVGAIQLVDEASNYVITVHAWDELDAEEQGEIVGTLHVKLWKSEGTDSNLQAWLDHATTVITLDEQKRKVKRV